MKYLRYINESYDLSTIRNFCEEYLAYLIDDGFKIEVVESYGYYEKFPILEISRDEKFKWSDIKDTVLPFLIILRDEYNMQHAVIFYQKRHNEYLFDFHKRIYQLTKDYSINDTPVNKIQFLFHKNQNKYRKKRNL